MSDVVKVTIFDQTSPISQAGFGLPLVFVDDAEVEYQEVSEAADITGLSAGDMGYEMVSQIFSQEPNPNTVAVWGSDLAATEPDYDSITEALDYLALEHNDFYFLLFASRVEEDIEEAADWATANGKLFVTQPEITTSASDIVEMAGRIESSRVGIFAHNGGSAEEEQYFDASIVGRMAPTDAGSSTWKFKTLNGVSTATYSKTEINELLDGNVNSYERIMGVNITNEGKETSGGFLDIQRGKDWLKARIEESIYFLLQSQEKVAYDASGIAQVTSELQGVLKRGVAQGIIATDEAGEGMWSVSAPSRSEIADADIADRLLPDIKFVATVAGAVHNVEVEGVLQV